MKYLRLARTISDLSGDEPIMNHAVWETITMRHTNPTKQQIGTMR
ncbi:hypothetical protein [Oceanobacillus polygoni]|uniref:ATPase with chaperone activity n=1 Tax=Oceanobacillus polygoni TaxID=1235259 RepID=A0A9X0YTC8_9BACI|nr:hypothetical protein [Oceanobacillus polygoni]MBP2076940.1 putative ATPase with chaperone activity [Oceanobacillus polygoni]